MTLVQLTSAVFLMLLQAPATGTAVLQGQVVRAGSAIAVPHAQIVAAKVGGQLADYRTAETDAAGRFTFRDLMPGTYRIYAQSDGYIQAEYGRRPAGTAGIPVVLAEGQTSPNITIELLPPGVIAGQVLDDGRPIRNILVRALKATYFDGQRLLDVEEYARTDDRGDFRLFDLSPGWYFVSAIPPAQPRIEGDNLLVPAVPSNANDNRSQLTVPLSPERLDSRALTREIYAAVYHPGTTDVELATPIEVRAGSVSAGITLTIARTPTFHVRGRASFPDAAADARVSVGVSPRSPGTHVTIPSVQTTTGAFEIGGVSPGRYVVSAQTLPPGPTRRFTARYIDVVDRDLDDVALMLQAGVTVSGRVSIDGNPPAAGDPPLLVQLLSAGLAPGYGAVRTQADGTFGIANVAPGEYRFRVIQAGRYPWIKDARFGADDVLAAPIRVDGDVQGRELSIALSTRTAAIDAVVLDRDRRPVSGALVIAVPDAGRRDQSINFRTATTGADGRVRLEQIVPGEYRLFASLDVEAAAWQDPAVLRRYEASGEAVRLTESGKVNLTLRITP